MSDPSLLGSLLRVGIVLVLLVGALRLIARKTGANRGRPSTTLFRRVTPGSRLTEVVDRCAVSRSGSVAVVRVADRLLVLGVTDQRIDVLETLDDVDTVTDPPGSSSSSAADLVHQPVVNQPTGRLKGLFAMVRPPASPSPPGGRRGRRGAPSSGASTGPRPSPRGTTTSGAAASSTGATVRTTSPAGHRGTAAPAMASMTDLRDRPADGPRLADDRTIELATAVLGRIEVAPHALGRVERAATAVATRPAFTDRDITPATFPGLRRDLLGDAYDDDLDSDDLDSDDRWVDDDDPRAASDDDLVRVRVEDRTARRAVQPPTSPARMPGESPAPWKALVEEIRGRLDD
jgi:flagellar biogenesis protein FliO